MNTKNRTCKTTSEDMIKSHYCTEKFISSPENVPMSFKYGEKEIKGISAEWNPITTIRRIDANITETLFEGNDCKTGLNIRVECLEYHDYPVVEWTVWLTNKGLEPTPVIQDLLAMEGSFEGTSPILHHCNGDFWKEDGYTPFETPLLEGDSLNLAPTGGRPCDSAFPYFRILFENYGLSIAVGWPAQWSTSFSNTGKGVIVRAGQEKNNLRLLPGESIRTPRITIMSWTGGVSKAINLWRHWYLDHILPRVNGKPLTPKLAVACNDGGDEFINATEENQIQFINKYKSKGFNGDIWWIDAGWYTCIGEKNENNWWSFGKTDSDPAQRMEKHWWFTGTWEPDPERFPKGLKPISDHAAKNGMDLLLWFEPERVTRGSRLDIEHPEWVLKDCDDPNGLIRLLNLGDIQCRTWLTEYICKLIKDNGIKIYRQDFNFPPLKYWRCNETEDRQGMNENLYVQGYLRFWDDLLIRNPGLWIDSCSAGGRRNDLETMRRSVPLHYSDYGYGDNPVKLAFHYTLFAWLPYFKDLPLTYHEGFDNKLDSYSFHCCMPPMLFIPVDIRRDDDDYELCHKMTDIWRRASDMLLKGDYYPLTPFSRSTDQWVALQFDIPETGKGFIQGIRHLDCLENKLTIYPTVTCPDANYMLENPETGKEVTIFGKSLLKDGFTFELNKRSGAIWFYEIEAASFK